MKKRYREEQIIGFLKRRVSLTRVLRSLHGLLP